MKKITTQILATAALGLSGLILPSARAITLPPVTNVVTLTARALVQNESPINNGTDTVTPAPTAYAVTTKILLKRLALDKFAQGSFGATNFPSGAKLVVFKDSGNAVFQVLGRTNNFLADVSDILGLDTGDNNIFSGKTNNATGLANSTTTERGLVNLSFDDTAIGGGGDIKFFLAGITVSVTTDTRPNSVTGLYQETQAHTTATAIGEGTYQGSELVISGSFNASGRATLDFTP